MGQDRKPLQPLVPVPDDIAEVARKALDEEDVQGPQEIKEEFLKAGDFSIQCLVLNMFDRAGVVHLAPQSN